MKTLIAVLTLALISLACGSTASSPLAPSVTPQNAELMAVPTFKMGTTSLGDAIDTLSVMVSTNLPLPVRIQARLTPPPSYTRPAPGPSLSKCYDNGCLIKDSTSYLFDWTCNKACPNGGYSLTLTACSYVDGTQGPAYDNIVCREQESSYLAWVGKLGGNLKSNPSAVPDATHAAILNLSKTFTFGHSLSGGVTNTADLAAAKAHASSIEDAANPFVNPSSVCSGDTHTTSCQNNIQAQIDAVDKAIVTVKAAHLPCAVVQDLAIVKSLEIEKAGFTAMLESSKSKNDAQYVDAWHSIMSAGYSLRSQIMASSNACP